MVELTQKEWEEAFDAWCQETSFQLGNCADKYGEKLEEYGESWRTMNLESLRNRLREEYEEWNNSEIGDMEQEELYDIINVCMMVLIRHEEYKKRPFKGSAEK